MTCRAFVAADVDEQLTVSYSRQEHMTSRASVAAH